MDDLSKRSNLKLKLSKDKRDVLLVTNKHNVRRIEHTTIRVIELVSRLARFSRWNVAEASIQGAIGL